MFRGANANVEVKDKWNALHAAVSFGNIEVLKLILETAEDIDAQVTDYQTFN